MTHYLICLGSNTEPARNIALAHEELKRLFPDVCFSTQLTTEPIGMKHSKDPFLNQLARFSAEASPAEVRQQLKMIERKAGRRAEEKGLEVVRLDLDLLMADDEPLRSDDLQRSFVQQLLAEF